MIYHQEAQASNQVEVGPHSAERSNRKFSLSYASAYSARDVKSGLFPDHIGPIPWTLDLVLNNKGPIWQATKIPARARLVLYGGGHSLKHSNPKALLSSAGVQGKCTSPIPFLVQRRLRAPNGNPGCPHHFFFRIRFLGSSLHFRRFRFCQLSRCFISLPAWCCTQCCFRRSGLRSHFQFPDKPIPL
jgi:hypothetical protein